MDGPPSLRPSDPLVIAEQLRLIRLVSQQRRYSGRPTPRLPSKTAILGLLDAAVALLYPRHFGPPDLGPEATEIFIRNSLVQVLTGLAEQVQLELMLAPEATAQTAEAEARRIAEAVLAAFVRIRDLHDTDIAAAWSGDPSAKSLDEIVFCFPGVTAILNHRIAHELYRQGATMIARIMAEGSHSRTGIDIHPGARIAAACFIDHGSGVVIGETAVIGRGVRIYQQVTLGAKRFRADESGTLIKGEPRHPVIEDDVVIYAGAAILGRITIGQGSVIGGGVWLTESLPPGSVVTQAPPELSVLTRREG